MRNLDPNKLAQLKTAESLIEEQYGAIGTPQRAVFDAESIEWYNSEYSNCTITLPEELFKKLSLQAKQSGQSLNKYVTTILANNLSLA